MKALIDSKEIQLDDIAIIFFSSVFDGVLQEFSNRFKTLRGFSIQGYCLSTSGRNRNCAIESSNGTRRVEEQRIVCQKI